jgi:hypothetical protein
MSFGDVLPSSGFGVCSHNLVLTSSWKYSKTRLHTFPSVKRNQVVEFLEKAVELAVAAAA